MSTEPKKIISPGVWLLFTTSAIVFISTLFISSWTSTGPTFFSPQEVNSTVDRVVPASLQVPTIDWELLLPIVAVLSLCICLRFIRATNGTRLIVKLIVLFLAARYFTWRTVATLNFSHPASTIFSLTIYIVEVISFFSCCLYMLQTIWSTSKQRRMEADRYSQAVISGEYLPSVDVLVPTYNEPDYIVRRTVIGCQAMEYPNKTIYILDDTRRPNIKALARELGCEYITRPDNTHAKAGNLNNALKYISGELIVPIDADFVPFKNFLTRTVGFFQNTEISLVQTPQYFYNSDYHNRNLGLENFLPNDLEHFYGLLQSNRDAANSVICCGSSYAVRRSCLDAVGGYYTRCCVEDFQTSLRMLTQGFRLIYLNEVLSTGESTRTYIDFIDRRLRWLQGNFQVYFCGKDIPIWSKLNWIQKSYSVSQLIYCFQPVLRAVFLLAPLCSAYLGISPFIATLPEVLYYFLPFWLLHIVVYGWATNYRVSYFWNNALLAGIAVLSAIDRPIRRTMDRFPLQTLCKITAKDKVLWGYTQDISESGAKVMSIEPEVALDTSHVEVTFLEYDFSVRAEIVRSRVKKGKFEIALQFTQLETEQQRKLVEVLYTEMTWWKQRKKPGSLDSFLAMISSIIQAKSLLNRYD